MKTERKIILISIIFLVLSFCMLFRNNSDFFHEIILAIFTSSLVSLPIQFINYIDRANQNILALEKDYKDYQNILSFYIPSLFDSISYSFRSLYKNGNLNEKFQIIDTESYYWYCILNFHTLPDYSIKTILLEFNNKITDQISLLEKRMQELEGVTKAKPFLNKIKKTLKQYQDNHFIKNLDDVIKYSYKNPSEIKRERYYLLLHNFIVSGIKFNSREDVIELYQLHLDNINNEHPFLTIYKSSK